MSSLWQNPEVFIGFLFSTIIAGDTASYFIQMIKLISLEYILAQTRMRFGRIALPSKGAHEGQTCLSYGKIFFSFFFL